MAIQWYTFHAFNLIDSSVILAASNSKLTGYHVSTFPTQARSVPPGFHPQVADDIIDPPLLKLSKSVNSFILLHIVGNRHSCHACRRS